MKRASGLLGLLLAILSLLAQVEAKNGKPGHLKSEPKGQAVAIETDYDDDKVIITSETSRPSSSSARSSSPSTKSSGSDILATSSLMRSEREVLVSSRYITVYPTMARPNMQGGSAEGSSHIRALLVLSIPLFVILLFV